MSPTTFCCFGQKSAEAGQDHVKCTGCILSHQHDITDLIKHARASTDWLAQAPTDSLEAYSNASSMGLLQLLHRDAASRQTHLLSKWLQTLSASRPSGKKAFLTQAGYA